MDSSPPEDREHILANFQAITGIEDIAVALSTLEQFDWDINNAIVASVSEDSPGPQISNNGPQPASSEDHTVKVDWKGREHSISLNCNRTTIGALKEILSERVGVPKNNFTVIGFPGITAQREDKTLEEMGVSGNCNLIMVEAENHLRPRGQTTSTSGLYKFKIVVEGTNHDLSFPSTTLISEVKSYVAEHMGVPVSQQRWVGWPPGTSGSLELRDVVLSTPTHTLTVSRNIALHHISDDESFMEDDTLESPGGESSLTTRQPLMSAGKSVEDNMVQFLQVFRERYGAVHPQFHLGSLGSALSTAFSVPADNKRPLIVFLHSDRALTGHLFCSQVVCSENIASYIDQNFVLWAHDMSDARLQHYVLTECQGIFGMDGRRQVEMYIPDKLPLMIVITKVQSSPQVFAVFQGDISPDLLMAQLVDAVENYSHTRSIERVAEQEQEQRNALRALQENEYLDSLARDRAKQETRMRSEKELQLAAQTEEAKVSSYSDLVPPEPEQGPGCTELTFKLPGGERMSRRFAHSTKLQAVSFFVGSRGYSPSEFKLVQNFPKRQFDEDELGLTLEELGLLRRELLYVEERE